jgi:hypothetical protein
MSLQFSDVETVYSLWVSDRTYTHNVDEYEPVKVVSFPEKNNAFKEWDWKKKIQHMPTFFKYSSSFNFVFRTGRFHTGLTQLLWSKNHHKLFRRRKRTSGEMAVKPYDIYVRSKMVRNYVELKWWLRMLLLYYALSIHTHFRIFNFDDTEGWRCSRWEFFLIVQTCSGDHTPFYLTDNVDLFPGIKASIWKLTTHLHLVSSLKVRGDKPPRPRMPKWRDT